MNKPRPRVPKPRRSRRALRTRRALGTALVQLMVERSFDDISVQQVLDRADVGRTTFYAHFRNKHDLLFSDAERFIDALDAYFLEHEKGRRVAPVAELFGHVAEFDAFQRALVRAGLRDSLFDFFSAHIAKTIATRIATLTRRGERRAMSDVAMSKVFAGALVELLRWWIDRTDRPSAREMDAQFHDLVWNGLAGAGRE